MHHTQEKPVIRARTRGRKPGLKKARRPLMSSATAPLEDQVLEILKEAHGQPLSLSEIAVKLGGRGYPQKDTVAVREAVWNLIRQGKADLNPRRHVLAIGT